MAASPSSLYFTLPQRQPPVLTLPGLLISGSRALTIEKLNSTSNAALRISPKMQHSVATNQDKRCGHLGMVVSEGQRSQPPFFHIAGRLALSSILKVLALTPLLPDSRLVFASRLLETSCISCRHHIDRSGHEASTIKERSAVTKICDGLTTTSHLRAPSCVGSG